MCFLVLAFLFLSSNHPVAGLEIYLSGADSLAINYFKGDGIMDTVVRVKMVKDKKVLSQFAEAISEQAVDKTARCGMDGSIHFFKNDVVIKDVLFRMNDVMPS